ncbi:hypothetical protein V8G54_011364 [Vigna mungo]|uniref:Non-haem dioxygenase N-terminal domain-containing protein n=1 Tax=Vigna mungo TaxID=3915 RepID=A0AAQ3NR75_VIGMU
MGRQSTQVSALNCIDLSNSDINQSVRLLKQACLDSGFFYVVNHGISQEFMDEVFAQSKKFFSLPLEEKMKILRNEKHRGYTPVLDELLDPENQLLEVLFPPILCQDYLTQRYKDTHADLNIYKKQQA